MSFGIAIRQGRTIALLAGVLALFTAFVVWDLGGKEQVSAPLDATPPDSSLLRPAGMLSDESGHLSPLREQTRSTGTSDTEPPAVSADESSGIIAVESGESWLVTKDDGTITFLVRDGTDKPWQVEAPVAAGRWRFVTPSGVQFQPIGAKLGSLELAVVSPEWCVGPVVSLEVRCRGEAGIELHVLDLADGTELDRCEVLGASGIDQVKLLEPPGINELQLLIGDAPSPIALPWSTADRRLWVRARDHEIKSIDIAGTERGVRRILLGPAGSLLVALSIAPGAEAADRATLLKRARIRIYPGEASRNELAAPTVEFRIAGASQVEIPNVPVGTATVRVELGPIGINPKVLAEANVSVLEAQRTSVELSCAVPEPPQRPQLLHGVVRFAGEEKVGAQCRVRAKLLDRGVSAWLRTVSPGPEGPKIVGGRLNFSFGDVEPGRYLVEVLPFGVQNIVDVEPLVGAFSDIEVLSGVEVLVRARDRVTQSAIRDLSVTWFPLLADGSMAVSRKAATYDEPLSAYRFVCHSRFVRIRAWSRVYGVYEHDAHLAEEPQVIELTLEPKCDLTIRLTHSGQPVLADSGFWMHAEVDPLVGHPRLEGVDWLHGSAVDGSTEANYTISDPGRFRLRLPELRGFRPITPIDVTFDQAGAKVLVVELENE